MLRLTDLAAEHLMQSLKNYNYDIIALSETHNIGMEDACGGQLIMSGGTTHYAGVGILMSKRAKSNLISTYYISDRVLAARFTLKRGHLFFIAVYAPTSTAPDDVIGQFYDQIQDCIDTHKKTGDILQIAGDFNAKLGDEKVHPVIGPYGYGTRNERGDRLLEFCMANNLTAASSWFPHRKSRKVTWISRAGNAKNAIDHILIDLKAKNWLTNSRSYSAVFDTDHKLVLANLKIKLGGPRKSSQIKRQKPNVEALKRPDIADQFRETVNVRVNHGDQLERIASIIHSTALETCGVKPFTTNQPYISDDTIKLIEEKRKAVHTPAYSALRNAVKRSCTKDLEAWIESNINTMNEAYVYGI